MRFVRVAWEALGQQTLQLQLDLCDRFRVEQLTQVLAAEQLGEQLAVERERLRPPLGERRVALVHELRHVREQQRGSERRGPLGVHRHDPNLPRADPAEKLDQRRHVEVIGHDLAPGLGEDREVGVTAGDLEQARAPHALLPQRRALAWPSPREQQ